MAAATPEARAEVEQACRAALAAAGAPDRVDKNAIYHRYKDRASKPTLYRWMDGVLGGTKPGKGKPPGQEARKTIRMAEEAGRQLVGGTDQGGLAGTIPLMAHLRVLMDDVANVRALAHHPDGKVKNARLLLQASDALRRNLESIMKIQASMAELSALERFHRAIMDELRLESPELAQRVVDRLTRLAGEWGG